MSGHTATPELLPCPFCNRAVQFRKALHVSDGNDDGIIHAEPSRCPMSHFADGSTDESIIAKWNTRTNSHAELVKALEEISRQLTSIELFAESGDDSLADYEGGYDALINIARAALATLTARKVG